MQKNFDPARDIVNQLSVVNEVISIGGSIFTGSAGEANIKRYNHWASGSQSGSFYQACYSTTYTSNNAVELVDITYGFSISSAYYLSPSGTNKVEKNKIYKEFAKMLLGSENSLFQIEGANQNELIFLCIRRSQFKDEIKKGSVALTSIFSGGVSGATSVFNERVFNDTAAATVYEQSIRGDVGNLVSGSGVGSVAGRIWYQAGIIALVPEKFSSTSSTAGNFWSGSFDYGAMATSGGHQLSGTYDTTIYSTRNRLRALSFTNQSNLHSTFFFCRALNDEFNYSSNPTFVDSAGRIIPTSGANNLITRTYITKVALFGENNEVLAIGALSEPLKKTPDTEYTLKVRLDF